MIDISHIVMGGVILAQMALHVFDRKHHQNQIESLLKGMLSKSAPEYQDALRTPEQAIKENQAESALAEKAFQMEKLNDPEGANYKPGERFFPVGT